MKHTEAFIEKHKRLIESREKAALEKAKAKVLRKEETKKRKLESARKRAERIKNEEPELYTSYLDYLKDYREKIKAKKKIEREEKIKELLRDKRYGVIYSNAGNPYYVTDKAEIYNWCGRVVNPHIVKNGYKYFSQLGKMWHKVVWETFNGKVLDGYEIDHIIPIKNGGTDELSNLRIVTHKENCNNPISIINYSNHNKIVDSGYLKKKVDKK